VGGFKSTCTSGQKKKMDKIVKKKRKRKNLSGGNRGLGGGGGFQMRINESRTEDSVGRKAPKPKQGLGTHDGKQTQKRAQK